MRSIFVFSSLLLATFAFAANRPGANAVHSDYVAISGQFSTNPPIVVSGITPYVCRTWDASVDWPTLSGNGTNLRPTHSDQSDYSWTNLLTLMNRCTKLIYTVQMSPQWATGSSDSTCHFSSKTFVPGSCHPPTDVSSSCTAQGSLAGQTFSDNCMAREFIHDLITKANANGTPLYAIELGNEPNACDGTALCDSTSFSSTDKMWLDTLANHVAMMKAVATQARTDQPGIILIAVSGTSPLNSGNCLAASGAAEFTNKWLGQWTGPALDYIGFHGYAGSTAEPISQKIDTLGNCPNITKPLMDTEGGWGGNNAINGAPISSIARVSNTVTATFTSSHSLTSANNGQNIDISGVTTTAFNGTFAIVSVPDTTHITWTQVAGDASSSGGAALLTANLQLQADYISRWYLIQFSRGVKSAIWYSMFNNSFGTLCVTFDSSTCNDTTARLARTAAGEMYKWLADATASGTCATNGTVWTCNYTKADGYTSQAVWDTSGASTYTFPAGYTQYRDTTGATNLLSGTTQAIGTTPILLEKIPGTGRGRGNN